MRVKQNSIQVPATFGFGPRSVERKESVPGFAYGTGHVLALLRGFDVNLDGGAEDFYKLLARVEIDPIGPDAFEVTGFLGMRTQGGRWQDWYSGGIDYTLVAIDPAADESYRGGTLSYGVHKSFLMGQYRRQPLRFAQPPLELAVGLRELGFQYVIKDRYVKQVVHLLTVRPGGDDLSRIIEGELFLYEDETLDNMWGLDDFALSTGHARFACLSRGMSQEARPNRLVMAEARFPQTRGNGPATLTVNVPVDPACTQAGAALYGLLLEYDSNASVERFVANATVIALQNGIATVQLELGLDSGGWDVPYQGTIQYAVLCGE